MHVVQHRITLDLLRPGPQETIYVNATETATRQLIICLRAGTKPYVIADGVSARIYCKKPDGAIVYNDCTISSQNEVMYTVTTQTIAAAGTVLCQLQLYNSTNSVLFSAAFHILVQEPVYNSAAVQSSNEYDALLAKQAELSALIVDVEINEAARASAESTRTSAETSRDSAETERISAESARETAEAARVTAETARASAESDRVNAEESRVSAEALRVSAEAARSLMENYDGTKAYAPGNRVAYNGSTYENMQECAGIDPTNTAYWILVASKGLDGQGSGDMLKSTYDTSNNGVVDNAEKLGGNLPAWYQQCTNGLIAETAMVDADTLPFYDASAAANRKTTWGNIKTLLSALFAPLSHASQHATGGADAITPAAIGADPSGTASTAVSDHNSAAGAHSALFAAKQNTLTPGTDYAIPAVDITATLSTTWTGSAAPYTQSVDIAGMTTAKKIQVGLAASCTAAQYAAAAKAQLHCTAQAAGAITITAFGEKPTVAIPIIVRVEG